MDSKPGWNGKYDPVAMKPHTSSNPVIASPMPAFHLATVIFCLLLTMATSATAEMVMPTTAATVTKLDWPELTRQQREILQPLADDWKHLDAAQHARWVNIAKHYPKMSPEEQRRVTQRMKEWAKLTPDDRHKARERYKALQGNATPAQRVAIKKKWKEYKQLSDTEKEELRQKRQSATATEPRG